VKPLSHWVACDPDDVGGAERVEAVDEGDSDVDFGGFAVGASCGDAVSEEYQAPHLRFCPASYPKLIADLRRRSAIEAEKARSGMQSLLSKCPRPQRPKDPAHLRTWLAWIIAAIWAAQKPSDRQ
jgi:hypothetical protein